MLCEMYQTVSFCVFLVTFLCIRCLLRFQGIVFISIIVSTPRWLGGGGKHFSSIYVNFFFNRRSNHLLFSCFYKHIRGILLIKKRNLQKCSFFEYLFMNINKICKQKYFAKKLLRIYKSFLINCHLPRDLFFINQWVSLWSQPLFFQLLLLFTNLILVCVCLIYMIYFNLLQCSIESNQNIEELCV